MKILCVGRNYAEHARELNNAIPADPIIFMKPPTAVLRESKPFYIPEFTHEVHYELELIVKICKNGKYIDPAFAHNYYDEVSVGIDFTARDLQQKLKNQGHPWEIAKAFDHSAVIGTWLPFTEEMKQDDLTFELLKNGESVQSGIQSDMIFGIDQLIAYMSRFFKLQFGDIIFTGTPAGVGPVKIGDRLEGFLGKEKLLHCDVK